MHRKFLSALRNHGSERESSDRSTNGTATNPVAPSSVSASSRSDDDDQSEFQLDQSPLEMPDPIEGNSTDNAELASLIARYGHAPATAWLERARYRIWRPFDPDPSWSFLPVQGYLHSKAWVFAWGSPLVSDKTALKPTLIQFITWVRSHDWRLVYCCVPKEVEELLADMGWSTVSCISEDVIDPLHILEMTHEDDEGGHGSKVKDLKKNLRRAERANIEVKRISQQDWSDDLKHQVEGGIDSWKRARKGLQLAATSFDPWLDFENREYWVALQHGKVVGVLILTPASHSYVIKNAASFPDAPKGTSERLIHTVLQDLHEQHPEGVTDLNTGHLTVTFNISAADDLKSSKNISDWKFTLLSKTYTQVAHLAHLMNRHDFRRKFDTSAEQMFVCYPTEDGFGREGIENLLKLLSR